MFPVSAAGSQSASDLGPAGHRSISQSEAQPRQSLKQPFLEGGEEASFAECFLDIFGGVSEPC